MGSCHYSVWSYKATTPVHCQAQVAEAEQHDVPVGGLHAAAVRADHGSVVIVMENVTNVQDDFRRVKHKKQNH